MPAAIPPIQTSTIQFTIMVEYLIRCYRSSKLCLGAQPVPPLPTIPIPLWWAIRNISWKFCSQIATALYPAAYQYLTSTLTLVQNPWIWRPSQIWLYPPLQPIWTSPHISYPPAMSKWSFSSPDKSRGVFLCTLAYVLAFPEIYSIAICLLLTCAYGFTSDRLLS